MQPRLWHQLLILLVGGVVFLAMLGSAALWDLDEALYSSIAREMLVRGDWVLPTYNGEVFYDKPPLMFWLMLGSFRLLGIDEFAARLPAALCGIVTALVTYHLGRRLFKPQVGLWAGLIMVSTIMFTMSARAATVDAALVLVTTLGMYAFVVGGRAATSFMYALFGVAVLAKGPVGILLPLATVGLYRLSDDKFGLRHVWNVIRGLRPVTGLLLAAAVCVPWYVMVAVRTHGDWLAQFVTKYNVGAFREASYGHDGSIGNYYVFGYHFVFVLVGLFPWSVFIGPMLWNAVRSVRDRSPAAGACRLCLIWIGVFFAFWSLCSTKLPHYVLPAYPPLALLTAAFLQDWLDSAEFSRSERRQITWWIAVGAGIAALVGVALLIAMPLVAAKHVPGEACLGLVGLPLLVGGAWCGYELYRGRRGRCLAAYAATSIAFVTMLFAWAAVRIDRHQHSRAIMAAVRADCPLEPQLATFRYLQASTVFYAGGPLPRLEKFDDLAAFLRDRPHAYVITTDEHYPEIERTLPGRFRMVKRLPKFLAAGEVIAIAAEKEEPMLPFAPRK